MRAPQPDDRWIWVSLRSATFAVVVSGGRVVDVAPYGRRLGLAGMDERAAAAKLKAMRARLSPLP